MGVERAQAFVAEVVENLRWHKSQSSAVVTHTMPNGVHQSSSVLVAPTPPAPAVRLGKVKVIKPGTVSD